MNLMEVSELVIIHEYLKNGYELSFYPDVIEQFGGDTRKIFANEYIDDRNIVFDLYCPICGRALKRGFKYCPGCGGKIEKGMIFPKQKDTR